MRFSTLSSILFALFFVTVTFVNAESYYNVDVNNLVRRDEAVSSSAAAPTATKTSAGHASTSSSTAEASTTTTAKKNKAAQFGNFASPPILQDGTLFYIGVSVTTLLWVTGKIIDIKTERQERYAERIAHQI